MLHVLFLQTIMSSNNVDIRVLNKRGEALKESAVADLTKAAFYQNHFNARIKKFGGSNNIQKGKVVVIHRIRGIMKEGVLKLDKKVLDFLKHHSMHLTRHDWLEEEWDTRVIGFYTTVIPKCMPREYATKVVAAEINQNQTRLKIPPFRLQNISLRTDKHHTRGYGLEVKAEDVRSMMAAIKANVKPGNFVPFHLRAANDIAFKKAVEYMNSKNETTWAFIVNYVSEGIFFKLEEQIKMSLNTEHTIFNPIDKSMKIIIPKKQFDSARDKFKEKINDWCKTLDPDDTRQFERIPEIAHLARDDFSNSSNSYTAHSISSILSFDIEEIEVKTTTQATTPPTTETTPSDLSDPILNDNTTEDILSLKAEIQKYKSELEKCTLKMEGFQVMLETIIEQVSKINSTSSNTIPRRPD